MVGRTHRALNRQHSRAREYDTRLIIQESATSTRLWRGKRRDIAFATHGLCGVLAMSKRIETAGHFAESQFEFSERHSLQIDTPGNVHVDQALNDLNRAKFASRCSHSWPKFCKDKTCRLAPQQHDAGQHKTTTSGGKVRGGRVGVLRILATIASIVTRPPE